MQVDLIYIKILVIVSAIKELWFKRIILQLASGILYFTKYMKAKVVIFGGKNSGISIFGGKNSGISIFGGKNSGISISGCIKPVYLATMIPVPQNFCDTLKALRKDFVWSGKKPKIKHSTFMGDYCEGD